MIYLAIVSLIWAFSFGLIGNTLQGIDSLYIASMRLGVALLIFLPFLRPKRLKRLDIGKLIGCGAIQFGVMYVCYLSAFRYIPSHLVALFSILTPVYVVLIHDLKQAKWTPRYFIAALFSVLGAAAIKAKAGDSGDLWIGFGLMQLAGIAFAFGQVTYRDWKRAHKSVHDREVFALLTLGGATLALVFFGVSGNEWPKPSISQWGVIAYLGIVASGLGFFLWNKGAALTNPGTLAAFNNVVVPLAMFASLFVFGEAKGASPEELTRLVIGSVLIGAALLIGQRK